jgi:aspartate aminotransferase
MPASRVSTLANELRGSAILRIAGEVRALAKEGKRIADLTVGDFSSAQFRIPRALEDGIIDALRQGETTYPPSIGLESLRTSVVQFYRERLGVEISLPSVLIASGARPAIYAVYRALVDRGDRVVFGVPSWNNDYYCEIVGANAVTIDCDARTNFLPTAEMLRPFIRDARLVALNSPLNPTGTVFDAATLADICDLVLEENARRGEDERPLFVMYDQVYWMLTSGGTRHVDPLSLRPAIAPYLVVVDAISKAFASTGLRVGWAVAAPDIIKPMNDIIGHIGAWAPRAEQVATARFLCDTEAVDDYLVIMRRDATRRLDAVYDGLTALRDDGLPVDCVRPQGAIYVSARFPLHGLQTPGGRTLRTDEEIREFLLHEAGLAAVPFSAFGALGDRGWFRLSIGAVSVETIESVIPTLRRALGELRDPAGRDSHESAASSRPARAFDRTLGAD